MSGTEGVRRRRKLVGLFVVRSGLEEFLGI
jgi:hypothetical protein